MCLAKLLLQKQKPAKWEVCAILQLLMAKQCSVTATNQEILEQKVLALRPVTPFFVMHGCSATFKRTNPI